MSDLTFQESWDLAVLEAKFPHGGKAPLFLPPSLYERVKDDPRFARVWMTPTPMLPLTPTPSGQPQSDA